MSSINTHNVFECRLSELINAALISPTEQAFGTIEHVHYTCNIERDLRSGTLETILLNAKVKHGNYIVIETLVDYDINGITRIYSDLPVATMFVNILDKTYAK